MSTNPKIGTLRAEVLAAGGVRLATAKLVYGVSDLVRDVTDSACAAKLAEDLDSEAQSFAAAVVDSETK